MALATLADLEHRFSAEVVKQWTDDDRDGVADADVVNAALEATSSDVEAMLYTAYPSVIPFDTANVPKIVKGIVVDYVGYALAGRRQKAAEHYETLFTQAMDRLQKLLQPTSCLLFPDNTVTYIEGSSQQEGSNAGAWSSTDEDDLVFTATTFDGFV